MHGDCGVRRQPHGHGQPVPDTQQGGREIPPNVGHAPRRSEDAQPPKFQALGSLVLVRRHQLRLRWRLDGVYRRPGERPEPRTRSHLANLEALP